MLMMGTDPPAGRMQCSASVVVPLERICASGKKVLHCSQLAGTSCTHERRVARIESWRLFRVRVFLESAALQIDAHTSLENHPNQVGPALRGSVVQNRKPVTD